MSKFVGFVYGKDNSPLYCEESRGGYYVINGNWSFGKNTVYLRGDKNKELRMVLPDMKEMEYHEACILIQEAANGHDNS
jgi:hypothetical protein